MADLQQLPDHILERQICTNCFKYLSVLPVIQNKKGDIFCGRCQKDYQNTSMLPCNDEKVQNSMFNIIAERYLFKCVNHYEGCKELLDINSSEEHEKECTYETHECFFCSFNGNWCQIVQHCIKEHPKNVTKNGLFQFEVGNEFSQKLVYTTKSAVFLFTIEITEEKFTIIISTEAKGNFNINQFAIKFFVLSDSKDALFMFNLFDTNSVNYFEKSTEDLIARFGRKTKVSCEIMLKRFRLAEKELQLEKRFSDFNIRERELCERESLCKKWESNLAQQNDSVTVLKNFLKKLSSTCFTCMECKNIVSNDVYFCSQNHCYCQNCLSNTCKICKKVCEFTNVVELNRIVVTCDWPNCKDSVSLLNFLEHKRDCLFREYKCPLKECTKVLYSHQDLINHWHCCKPPLIRENVIEYDKYNEYEYYWLLNKELYHVVVHFRQGTLYVIIEEVSVLLNNYTFKIEKYCPGYARWEETAGVNVGGKYIVYSNTVSANGYNCTNIKVSALQR